MKRFAHLRQRPASYVLAAGLAVALAACSSGGSKDAARSATSQSVETQTLNFGVGSDPSTLANGIYLYGIDQGIFKKHGLNFNMKYLTPAAVQAALLSGDVDVAYDGDGMLIAAAKSKGKIIMTPGSIPFAIFAKKKIALTDLRGKTIASSTPGGAFTAAVQKAIRDAGLDPAKDVKIVYLQGAAAQYAALKAGEVDSAVLSPPTTVKAKAEGFTDIADVGADAAPGVIAANAKFYADHKDVLQKFIDSMKEATQDVLDHPDIAKQVYLRVNKTVDPALVTGGIADYLPFWEVMPYPVSWAKEVLAKNPDTKGVDPASVIDSSFVKKAGELPAHG